MTTHSLPALAPHDPCIVCFKGDTTTVVGFDGSLEWKAGGLIALGVPPDQAVATVEQFAPVGRPMVTLVCERCAARAGFPVMPVSGGKVPVSRQPVGRR